MRWCTYVVLIVVAWYMHATKTVHGAKTERKTYYSTKELESHSVREKRDQDKSGQRKSEKNEGFVSVL